MTEKAREERPEGNKKKAGCPLHSSRVNSRQPVERPGPGNKPKLLLPNALSAFPTGGIISSQLVFCLAFLLSYTHRIGSEKSICFHL